MSRLIRAIRGLKITEILTFNSQEEADRYIVDELFNDVYTGREEHRLYALLKTRKFIRDYYPEDQQERLIPVVNRRIRMARINRVSQTIVTPSGKVIKAL